VDTFPHFIHSPSADGSPDILPPSRAWYNTQISATKICQKFEKIQKDLSEHLEKNRKICQKIWKKIERSVRTFGKKSKDLVEKKSKIKSGKDILQRNAFFL
jgi:hypothetical protein